MINMVLKMSLATILYILLTVMIWIWVNDEKISKSAKIGIGIIYGVCSIISTHFGIDYGHMMLNVRDLGPLIAGLFFDPVSGLIAGFIGGIERYFAAVIWNIGVYTKVACSVSTCLAGIFAMYASKRILRGKKPSPVYALFIGAVMEVFHMYAVLITHIDDMRMAYYVVDICSFPMIIFTAVGLSFTSIVIITVAGEWENPFKKVKAENVSLSDLFQKILFNAIIALMIISFIGTFATQTELAYQNGVVTIDQEIEDMRNNYLHNTNISDNIRIGLTGRYCIYGNNGKILHGTHKGESFPISDIEYFEQQLDEKYFIHRYFGEESMCKVVQFEDGNNLLVLLPMSEVFWYRNSQSYETIFSFILLISLVYVLITAIVHNVVVDKIDLINASLYKITNGDLNEVVNVRTTSEFAVLSDDINKTVTALKGYIDEANKKMEEELKLASSIQMSALPSNFVFPNHNEFEMYALMDAAKEVGGDFYDFYFVGKNKLALVIADVSGKGIPGALFMMRAKTAIRSFAEASYEPTEILYKANNSLCDGNDNEMFVTAWIGIINLETGIMKCSNYGHEYPIIMKNGSNFEIYKDAHSLPLAAFENTQAKEYEIKLSKGDKLFVYTDGVPEATNRSDEAYGMDRLISVLNKHKSDDLEDTLKSVREDVAKFADEAEQFDDITMFGFKYNGYNKV